MTGQGTTTPFRITPGAAPVPVTDGGNSPAGLLLVNRGDNGGTVWIQAGPTGGAGAVPLGPAASLPWTDPRVIPYAYMTAGAAAGETLVVSNQMSDYSNPTAVAVATARQLTADGVPNLFRDGLVFDNRLDVTQSTGLLDVSQYSSLLIGPDWPQPTPSGPAAIQIRFSDPAIPGLEPFGPYITNDNAMGVAGQWRVPVEAPFIEVVNDPARNVPQSPLWLSIVGTNRPVDRFQQITTGIGARTLMASPTPTTAGTRYQLLPENNGASNTGGGGFTGAQRLANLDNMTRFNGLVTLTLFSGTGAGSLYSVYVDETGSYVSNRLRFTAADTVTQWAHPSVPVTWYWNPDASTTGQNVRLTVWQA